MRWCLYLAMLAACSKSADKDGDKTKDKGAASTAPGPTVSVAGAQVALPHTFIKRLPVDGRFQIHLTDAESSCQELRDNVFMHLRGHTSLLFDVGPRLVDGKLATTVTYIYQGGDSVAIAPGAKVTVTGNANDGTEVAVTIDATATSSGKAGAIAIHGAFTAQGCGESVPGADGKPKAAHPSTATIAIAGTRLPIAGAIRTGPQRALMLSTGPKDCSSTTPWAAAILEESGRDWKLHGLWFEKDLQNSSMPDRDTGQPETAKLRVTPGATGTSADGPTVQLELAGDGTIGGVPVALAGAIEALDCPESH